MPTDRPLPFAGRETEAILSDISQAGQIHRRHGTLDQVCRRYGLTLLVLFGTYATGRAHANSDVDIAVLPAVKRRPNLLSVYADLVPAVGNDSIDIVDLRRAPPLLAWNIAREGILLYAPDRWEWLRFQSRAYKQWDDVKRFERWRLAKIDRSLCEWGVTR